MTEKNEHIIIVSDTQNFSNLFKENANNSARDNFFLYGQDATNTKKRKNRLFILRF